MPATHTPDGQAANDRQGLGALPSVKASATPTPSTPMMLAGTVDVPQADGCEAVKQCVPWGSC